MHDLSGQELLDRMGADFGEIELRKRLLGIGPNEVALLEQGSGLLQNELDNIVDEFFDGLKNLDELAPFFKNTERLERLRRPLREYVASLFGGSYDTEYVQNRLHIGLIHEEKGVQPKFYVSAVKLLKDILRVTLARCTRDDHLAFAIWNAVDRLLCFDTLFILDTYFRSLMSDVDRAKGEAESYARCLEEKVAARTRELEELSRRDSLTDLYNHRAFNEFLRRDLALAIRNNAALSLVYLDVDDFKLVNDERGHHEGDQVLKDLGKVLMRVSRESDMPCRYGGDEFCIILPNSNESQARAYCQRVIAEFSKHHPNIGLSIGVVQSGPDEHIDMDTLIQRADRLMYTAKRNDTDHIAS